MGDTVNDRAPAPLSPATAQFQRESKITKPTVSNSRKHQVKWPEKSTRPWLVSGASGAGELISDRRPALFEENYDAERMLRQEEVLEAKERWFGDSTILPTSCSEAKGSCDSSKPVVDYHIALMREKGRTQNESLKERYDSRLKKFQEERKERGAQSGFERSMEAKDRAAEAARKAASAR